MKKVLMLSASHNDERLIRGLKKLGCYVITTGNRADLPGHKLADEYVYGDYSDLEAMLELAKRLEVDAVCPCCNDFGVKTAAYVQDKLGFKGQDSYETTLIIHDKDKFKKFAEELSHRDYLGAVLNLGIERSKTGDILVDGNNALIFVHRDMTEVILRELTRVRHTSVRVDEIPVSEISYEPACEEIRGTVASVRLDSLLALAFSSSRTRLTGLIEGAKVYVNGRLVTSNGYQPAEGDIVSVRGMGKFRFESSGSRTRKNRITVVICKYV